MKKKLFSIFLAVMVLLSVPVTAFAECIDGYHNYVETAYVEPTPTEFGYVQFTCTICGDWYRETLAYEPPPEEPAPEPPAEEAPEGTEGEICESDREGDPFRTSDR